MFVYINTDGRCIDNRTLGLASAAYVIRVADGKSTYLGSRSITFNGTNNDAEYRGLLLALDDLKLYPDIEGVQFRCDSQLIVRQVTDVYHCNNNRMAEYLRLVKEAMSNLSYHCSIKHVGRASNYEADWLCTHALYCGPKTDHLSTIPTRINRQHLKRKFPIVA
jgi:ribonuclease HI